MPKRPKYSSASVARAAKVWFGDSLCILICLSRTGGWTRPLFIPSSRNGTIIFLDKLGVGVTTPVFGVSDEARLKPVSSAIETTCSWKNEI